MSYDVTSITNNKADSFKSSKVSFFKQQDEEKAINKAALEFEKMFFKKIIKKMFEQNQLHKTKSDDFDAEEASHSTAMFRDLWVDALANSSDANKFLGLHKYIAQSMKKTGVVNANGVAANVQL